MTSAVNASRSAPRRPGRARVHHALRERLAALLPAAELMLEVDAWTGFTAPMTDMVTGGGTRASDLGVSVCAVLVVQACNVPYGAVARRDVPALTESRLRWVEENYVRAVG